VIVFVSGQLRRHGNRRPRIQQSHANSAPIPHPVGFEKLNAPATEQRAAEEQRQQSIFVFSWQSPGPLWTNLRRAQRCAGRSTTYNANRAEATIGFRASASLTANTDEFRILPLILDGSEKPTKGSVSCSVGVTI